MHYINTLLLTLTSSTVESVDSAKIIDHPIHQQILYLFIFLMSELFVNDKHTISDKIIWRSLFRPGPC